MELLKYSVKTYNLKSYKVNYSNSLFYFHWSYLSVSYDKFEVKILFTSLLNELQLNIMLLKS